MWIWCSFVSLRVLLRWPVFFLLFPYQLCLLILTFVACVSLFFFVGLLLLHRFAYIACLPVYVYIIFLYSASRCLSVNERLVVKDMAIAFFVLDILLPDLCQPQATCQMAPR